MNTLLTASVLGMMCTPNIVEVTDFLTVRSELYRVHQETGQMVTGLAQKMSDGSCRVFYFEGDEKVRDHEYRHCIRWNWHD